MDFIIVVTILSVLFLIGLFFWMKQSGQKASEYGKIKDSEIQYCDGEKLQQGNWLSSYLIYESFLKKAGNKVIFKDIKKIYKQSHSQVLQNPKLVNIALFGIAGLGMQQKKETIESYFLIIEYVNSITGMEEQITTKGTEIEIKLLEANIKKYIENYYVKNNITPETIAINKIDEADIYEQKKNSLI